jgi:hypothetical protein
MENAKRLGAFVICAALGGCSPGSTQDGDQSRIIGGTPSTGDPSVVSLTLADGSPNCTASVVRPTVLLTAAHCVDTVSRYRAAFGNDEQSPTSTIDVLETHADVAFNDGDYDSGHDIAVAILASPAPVAALPMWRDPLPASVVGQSARLVGFGVTDTSGGGGGTKRQITLPVLELRPLTLRFGVPGSTACSGDSGGPAFMNLGGGEKIVGVTSYGTDDDCTNGIVFYTRLDANMAFLTPYLDGTATIGAGSTGPPIRQSTKGDAPDGGAPDDGGGKPDPVDPVDPGKEPDPGIKPPPCDPYKDPGCK